MARTLDKKWQHWLLTNVQRGCSTEELKQILAREGYGEAAIRKAFNELPDLQAMAATAAKASINVPNARRFESSSIELYTAEGFLDRSECAELAALVKAALRPSTISTPPSGEADQLFRTSRTCDLIGGEGAIARLDAKIARVMGIDPRFAETSQGPARRSSSPSGFGNRARSRAPCTPPCRSPGRRRRRPERAGRQGQPLSNSCTTA